MIINVTSRIPVILSYRIVSYRILSYRLARLRNDSRQSFSRVASRLVFSSLYGIAWHGERRWNARRLASQGACNRDC